MPMDDNIEYPISTLKVDFGCTKGCPMDVRNMLQQLKGVKSISIDPNKGKVTVIGDVNPTTLIKLLQRMGKKAQLWSFVKEPKKKSRADSHHKQKHHSHRCCESSDSEDEFETDHIHNGDSIHRARYGESRKKMYEQNGRFGFGNEHTAAPPVTRYHIPIPPMSGYHHQPFSGYHHPPPPPPPPMPWNQPMAYARPSMYPRLRPMYGYYGQGQPMMRPSYGYYDPRLPKHNPMIHYTSYADNYRYTM